MCYGDLGSIYRYVGNNELKGYPNPYVAAAWDRDWADPIYIDCCSLTINGNFLQIPQRQSVTFKDRNIGTIYWFSEYNRFEEFLTPNDAMAYDPVLWQCPMRINYYYWSPNTNLSFYGSTRPLPFMEGQSIKCIEEGSSSIYRFTESQGRRWYPNPSIASSWDPENWANPVLINCSDYGRYLRRGPPMQMQVLRQGETVKCPESTRIYRFENNQLRYYPTTALAGAWDPYWQCPKTIDCTRYSVGANIMVPPLHNISY